MKSAFISIGLGLLFNSLYLQAQIKIQLSEIVRQKIRISFRDSLYESFPDSSGTVLISIPAQQLPGYATLFGPKSIRPLFIDPQKELKIRKDAGGDFSFSGSTAAINNYLNSDYLRHLTLNYGETEAAFIAEWETLPHQLELYLNSVTLPDDFKKMEQKRLYWLACNILLAYPLHHSRILKLKSYRPTKRYYTLLAQLVQEDDSLTDLNEYRLAWKGWMAAITSRENEDKNPYHYLLNVLKNIDDNIASPRLKEYLADVFITGQLRYTGSAHLKEIKSLYDKWVGNPQKKASFARLCEKYSLISKGKTAPPFCLPDINGRERSLTDFRGNYAYIDVWASWCSPCCKEFQALKRLEQMFQGKKIRFIGISIDRDSTAWIKKVRAEQLNGIQLRDLESSTFKEDYRITLIPRFILLDPQGRIINAEMTRPSDPRTEVMLRNLLDSETQRPQ